MGRGGKRPGAGRKKGVPNRTTQERRAAMESAAAVIEAAIDAPFEGDAHALLMAVYKDPKHDWSLRVDAAKAAIKFEKPALSSVQAAVALTVDEMTDEQLDDAIARDAAESGLLAQP